MTDTHSIAQPFEAEVSPANNRQLTEIGRAHV